MKFRVNRHQKTHLKKKKTKLEFQLKHLSTKMRETREYLNLYNHQGKINATEKKEIRVLKMQLKDMSKNKDEIYDEWMTLNTVEESRRSELFVDVDRGFVVENLTKSLDVGCEPTTMLMISC